MKNDTILEIKRHKDLFFTNHKFIILPIINFKEDAFKVDKPIVFVHTSKTGGTSIDYLVKSISTHHSFTYLEAYYNCPGYKSPNFFPQGCLGGVHLIKTNPAKYNMNNYPNVKFLLGHIPLANDAYFKKEVQYISIIRDPVDRLISLGNYIYQRKFIPDHTIKNYITSVEVDNLQTRALAGEEYMQGPCSESVYQKAIENIKTKFALVAPTEDVDSVMAVLANYFNMSNIAYTRAQITAAKFISKDDLQLSQQLLERNSYDKKLYDFVTNYWQEWKDNHIESTIDNVDDNKNYTVLSASYYKNKKLEYMNLDQMLSYEVNQEGELIGLTQYYK